MRKIQITIRPDGTQKMEVLDAVGADCKELTRIFEQRLGVPDGDRVLKPEFYETERESQYEQDREREAGS